MKNFKGGVFMKEEQKKMVVVLLVALIVGICIGNLITYANQRNTEAYVQYRLHLINACSTGCYNLINILLYENETFSYSDPVYQHCRIDCQKQYGI